MRFAMIPINRRYNENNERVVRRVLISYKYKLPGGKYTGTKLIDKDPYFDNPKSSQQYIFTDSDFCLVSNAYGNDTVPDTIQNTLIEKKRKYEFDAGLLLETAIEFQAADLQEAIEKFQNRVELH